MNVKPAWLRLVWASSRRFVSNSTNSYQLLRRPTWLSFAGFKRWPPVISLVGLLLLSDGVGSMVSAQSFGKNHVQYKEFRTKILQSKHFDIYFHEGGYQIAVFTAETAEQSYAQLQHAFDYSLDNRIKIIVYNSHNDFEQTNISLAPPEESLGGFTEFFKNRVVVPYEGDWEKFRHVIHHELTHAVMLQMLYGTGLQSIIAGLARAGMPLWFMEGMAEYQSRGWDTESDMFMRDAVINGYLPPVDELYGLLAYKGGQAVFHYLAQKYGEQKVGEVMSKLRVSKSVDRAMREAIGLGTKDFSVRWHRDLRKQYWPDIAGRREPTEFADRLTNHLSERNFINNGAALSPKGDKLVYLSDRSDYFDVYLMDVFTGEIIAKLVSGQRSGDLEELHWLRPGFSWSPDGQYIVLAAKAGAEDALHIVEVAQCKIVRSLKFGLDGVFSPAWSPLGNEIAFVGTKKGVGDLYAVDLATAELRQLTDDVFSDLEPSYSPDGFTLAFVSDRGDFTGPTMPDSSFQIWQADYRNLDVYTVDAIGAPAGGTITRITATATMERTPVYSPDGSKLAFTSDRSGVFNIHLHDRSTGREYPITNVLTGISELSWAGTGANMTFVCFFNGGYDVYLLKNPLTIAPGEIVLPKTSLMTAKDELDSTAAVNPTEPESTNGNDASDKYRRYYFGKQFAAGQITPKAERVALPDSNDFLEDDGSYKVKPYRPVFTPDIVYGSAGYNQFFGVQGLAQLSFSDVMGNHRFDLLTDLLYDVRNTNFVLRYFHLPKRVDYGIALFHNVWYFYGDNNGLMQDRYFGLSLAALRPLNRFHRLEAHLGWLAINREFVDLPDQPERHLRAVTASLSYVTDTARWGMTGPNNGRRSEIALTIAPRFGQRHGLGFVSLRSDYRRYFKFWREHNFALRLAGGLSEGSNPQQFFLGGISNWINPRFQGGIRIERPEDIYFSTFETPLRGASYYEQAGNRFVLMNFEYRFPLVRYLVLGWPLPLGFRNIRGAVFSDIGAAWQGQLGKWEHFRPFKPNDSWVPQLDDLLMGYGVGARANLGFLLLRIDAAWQTDLHHSSPKPSYYFSLGAEF